MTVSRTILAIVAAAVLTTVAILAFYSTAKTPSEAASAPTSTSRTPSAAGKQKLYRPTPVSGKVRKEVEAIIQRHSGISSLELTQSEELNFLMDRFLAKLNTPEMLDKIGGAVADVQSAKGVENGCVMMQFSRLDDPVGRAWLEAAVSDDAERIQNWVLNRLEGAAFEFALDPGLERSADGVTVKAGPGGRKGAWMRELSN